MRYVLRSVLAFAVLGGLGMVTAGCSGDPEPTDPGGAYRLFRKALVDKDVDAIWKRCDSRTREYFQNRYQDLVTMDRKIENYLPGTDHALARKDTGTELLDKLEDAKALFAHVLRPERVVVDEPRQLGAKVEEIRMSEDNSRAVVVTYAGQTFRMVKGDDSEWSVALVDSVDAVKDSFEWLRKNKSALEKTIDERIADERAKRERVIAELFDVEE